MSTLAMLAAHSPPRADPDSPLALYRKSEERYDDESIIAGRAAVAAGAEARRAAAARDGRHAPDLEARRVHGRGPASACGGRSGQAAADAAAARRLCGRRALADEAASGCGRAATGVQAHGLRGRGAQQAGDLGTGPDLAAEPVEPASSVVLSNFVGGHSMARQCKRAAESSPCNKRGPRRDVANVCRIRQSQTRLGKPVLILT